MKKQNEQRLVPKLRFKGFSEDWEQEKLSNVANIVGGGTPSTKESSYWNGDINWFTPNEIGDSKYVKDSLRRITEKGLNNSSAQLLPANKTILFTSRATIGTIGILEEEASTNQGFQSLIVNDFNDVNFLYYKLLTMKKLFLKNSVGSTFLEISGKTMKKIDINIPSKTEQEKIGKLLSKIDKAISLHTKKEKYLKSLKDAILLEMIPRKNMNKAKLYFNNEDWVKTTLNSVLSIPKNERLEVTSPSQLLTVKLNLGGVQEGSNRETLKLGSTVYYKRFPGQFIYGKQNFFNGGFGIIGANLKNKGSSGDVPTLDISNINPHYLFLFLSRKYYYQDKERFSSGTGSKRIHEKTLLDFDIAIPSKKQQEKIVKLINSLDKQIENNEHKISSLKLLKQKYLKDMFV